ncbi:MAG TPA: hypothetical protein VFB81_20935, partial [Myxococcales bacterium]|nr:hypothetical protein [Myxococcales bacterium]
MTRTFAARALPALAALALWPAAALAQLPDTFQLERLRISPDAASLSSVEGGEVQPDLTWSAGMWTGWSQNPLVAYRLQDGARAPLVANRVGGSVFGAFGFRGWAQLSVELPVVLFQDRQLSSIFPASELSSLSAAGVGTLRVTPKVQLLSARDRGVDLALQAAFGIPLSSGASYTGEPGLAFSPGVAISRTLGDFRLAGGVGATLRQNTTLLNAEIGPELEAQAGAGWQPSLPSGQQLPLSVELAVFAGTSATRPFAQTNETPVELRGLLTYQP